MLGAFKRLVFLGAVTIGAAIASTVATAASTAPPQVSTTYLGATLYPCSNGTCTIGPGNTGMPFAAAMDGTGGPPYSGLESNPYDMSVAKGSLPPGLKLALPDAEWMIMGTPTAPGTYTFTVQIVALAGGPDGYQQFSITIGSGGSDSLEAVRASYLEKFGFTAVEGFDVNVGATYTVYNTATGAELGTLREVNSGDGQPFDGDGKLVSDFHSRGANSIPQEVTVRDSLGSAVTVTVVRVAPYR